MIAAVFTKGVLVVFLAVIDFLESRLSELTLFLHALLALAESLVGGVRSNAICTNSKVGMRTNCNEVL